MLPGSAEFRGTVVDQVVGSLLGQPGGARPDRRTTTIDGSLVTSHNDSVTGLTAVTIYQNRVLSRDGTNNLTTNGDHNRPPYGWLGSPPDDFITTTDIMTTRQMDHSPCR